MDVGEPFAEKLLVDTLAINLTGVVLVGGDQVVLADAGESFDLSQRK